MSRPRFLADQDFNEHIIIGVLRREPLVDFVRARDVGLAEKPDSEILEFAALHERIVVSHDVNTMPAEACGRIEIGLQLFGLLMVGQSHPVGPIVDDLLLIWSASDAEEWHNQVRFLPL